MIFESKNKFYDEQNDRYLAEWSVDTDTITVKHTEHDTLEVKSYEFFEDCIRYHLHFSEENYPDRLQKLVDDGTILKHLEEIVFNVNTTATKQAQIWMDSDKEYRTALEMGNLPEVERIGNNYTETARREAYDVFVYV